MAAQRDELVLHKGLGARQVRAAVAKPTVGFGLTGQSYVAARTRRPPGSSGAWREVARSISRRDQPIGIPGIE